MMTLYENEMKCSVIAHLMVKESHEMDYDGTMHHTHDWNRNPSHAGLIEVPLTSDNPEYLRDEVGRAHGDHSDNEEALLSAQN